ncbi:hypothetical protein NX801_06485 [Streptomyces sp. LP05-1]|uniref:Integral membrane protein n=1 Tax=Streptomyces pyxinae TaxID=2970734 RepID=A0ABT2CD45_9ACTN|nr:hypothetical protein [Streptomyces sp. LP05-1]MCS0635309.1 hypothetical protein [Streptomyces sp. LP05-1]
MGETGIGAEAARRALGRVSGVEAVARWRGGWYGRYLWVYAAGQLLLVPMALLWHGPVPSGVYGLSQLALVTGLSLYALRQPVVRRGLGRTVGAVIGVWGVLFGASVVLGLTVWRESPVFAAVAAVCCALPPTVGAWCEGRRAG